MMGIFDLIERKVRENFGDAPVCVHVGNVDECDIKRHPVYSKFRRDVIAAGVKSAPSSRMWESLIAIGRLSDLMGDETWRLVILDCIIPCFRSVSVRVSRDFGAELEEVQSAMVVTALEVWNDTSAGVSPRHVRDRMVKGAFDVAYRKGSCAPPEYPMDEMELFLQSEAPALGFGLRAASIINSDLIRDADFAEQLKGERYGAVLQKHGCMEDVLGYHDEIRTGRRSGSVKQSVMAPRLSRFSISGVKNYYYTSDLYPSFIGLKEAAVVMGITESAAHRLIRAGQFPFPVARAGRSYKVSTKALMHFKEIPDVIVHMDDVENGARHASAGAWW
ncbi:helix-turn-helix domain-containing protein [Streptomyces sp. HSW2009]|uniref:helix-turn-helix transcriptional regulator n=1 Tax=Streptomyces sp. HSW2009 TaxID=3142890 RepID=UPI0032ECB989